MTEAMKVKDKDSERTRKCPAKIKCCALKEYHYGEGFSKQSDGDFIALGVAHFIQRLRLGVASVAFQMLPKVPKPFKGLLPPELFQACLFCISSD